MPLYDDATQKETREVTNLTEIAERIARELHAKQRDKQGEPYTEHLRRVADGVEGDEAKAVAWLHDSLEDVLTGETGYLRLISMLHEGGADYKQANSVVRCVDALTRSENETYADYIERIAARSYPVIAAVKLSDLRDNLRPGVESPRSRYLKAIERLEMAQKDRASV